MSVICEQIEQGIVKIVFSNPPVNSLDLETKTRLAEAFEDYGRRPDVCAIILCADEKAKGFSAGSNFNEFMSYKENFDEYQKVDIRLVDAMNNSEAAIILGVKGYDLAMGIALTAYSDIVVASDDAYFGVPEINVGIVGAFDMLCYLTSVKQARYMSFTGDYISAQRMYEFGNVQSIVPRAALMDECLKIARKIASKYPKAIHMYRRIMMTCMHDAYTYSIAEISRQLSQKLMLDPAREEMMARFHETKTKTDG